MSRLASPQRSRAAVGVALAVAAVAVAGCGGGDSEGGAASGPVTFELAAENGSGQTGTATLTANDDGTFSVVLEVEKSGEHMFHPAHIHTGTCGEYRELEDVDAQLATVSDELQDVADGRSESTVSVPLAERLTGTYSINVHEPIDPYPVVACGDIPPP